MIDWRVKRANLNLRFKKPKNSWDATRFVCYFSVAMGKLDQTCEGCSVAIGT